MLFYTQYTSTSTAEEVNVSKLTNIVKSLRKCQQVWKKVWGNIRLLHRLGIFHLPSFPIVEQRGGQAKDADLLLRDDHSVST